ncbi:MAG: hypothetical protein RR537_01165 [Longicatena sp.]
MKKKKNFLVIIGVVGILIMFVISLFFPHMKNFAKVGALAIYGFVSYMQIDLMKRKGQDIGNSVLFSVVVIIAIGYLLFFT